jgi:hypothetical protein
MTQTGISKTPLNCNCCGKFVSREDLETENAIHYLISFEKEVWGTLCRTCYFEEDFKKFEKKIRLIKKSRKI